MAAHTEPRTIVNDCFHFEIVLKFKNLTQIKNMALCLIPRSETIVDMMSFGSIAEYMKKQSPAIIVNQKSVHYKCNEHGYKLIGSLDTSLMALKQNHTMGVYIEKGGEWMTGKFLDFLTKIKLKV